MNPFLSNSFRYTSSMNMIGNNKDTATEGSQVVRVKSGGGQPYEFFNWNYLFYPKLVFIITAVRL